MRTTSDHHIMLVMESRQKENEQLLNNEELLDGESINTAIVSIVSGRRISRWLLASFMLNLFLIGTGIYLFVIRFTPQASYHQDIYSPAQDALAYKTLIFHNNADDDRTIYQGPPSDEVDAAWEDLYRNLGISQIDKRSAARLPNRTAPLSTGSEQYIVALDVFHQLHCLNMIRKSLYPSHYGGHPLAVNTSHGALNETEEGNQWHMEHCVDSIRQSLMCSVDISTIFWHWLPDLQQSAPSAQTIHTCRDFERVKDWAIEHRLVDEFDDKAPF